MKFVQISILLLICSCSRDVITFKSEKQFNDFLAEIDNGYIQKTETEDFICEAMLVPPIKGDTTHQFLVKFRLNCIEDGSVLDFGKVSAPERMEREAYLFSEVINDVFIDFGDHQDKPIMHHYERNYGLKPGIDLIFYFNGIKPKDNVTFNMRDQLFDQGLIKLNFNKELFVDCYVEKK